MIKALDPLDDLEHLIAQLSSDDRRARLKAAQILAARTSHLELLVKLRKQLAREIVTISAA